MAINEKPSYKNEHTIYVARTGAGKSQAMAQNPAIPKKKRAVLWDPHNDFKAEHSYMSLQEFGYKLASLRASDDFTLAYKGRGSQQKFDLFCQMVWEFLDGNYRTYLFIDELADVVQSIAKDNSAAGELLRGGRKFGLVVHTTAVSAAEIPKTIWKSCQVKWLGAQGDSADDKRCADVLKCDVAQVSALKPLDFLIKDVDGSVSSKTIKIIKTSPLPI